MDNIKLYEVSPAYIDYLAPHAPHLFRNKQTGQRKLDRFARDRFDSAHYKHILKKNGVRVISATESISDGPEGIIDCFVNAVYVYDDRIVFVFNYKDGTATVSLDDVNGSDLEGRVPPNE